MANKLVRYLRRGLAAVLLLLVLLWLSSPWWTVRLIEYLAGSAGFTVHAAELSRPTPDGLRIGRLALASPDLTLVVEDGQFHWTGSSLAGGRIDAFRASRVRVTQAAPGASAEDPGPFDSAIVGRMPVDRIDIDDLDFRAPHLPLHMHGNFRLADRSVHLDMQATESPAGIPVGLVVRLDASGEFQARFQTSADPAVHAFDARGSLRDGRLVIAGQIALGDYELGLLTGLLGLTPMQGTLTGPIEAVLDERFEVQSARFDPVIALRAAVDAGRVRRFSLSGHAVWLLVPEGGVLTVELADTSASKSTSVNLDIKVDQDRVAIGGRWRLSRSDLSALLVLLDFGGIEGKAGGDFNAVVPLPLDPQGIELASKTDLALTLDGVTTVGVTSLALDHQPAQAWTVAGAGIEWRERDAGTVMSFAAPEISGEIMAGERTTFRFLVQGEAGWADESMQLKAGPLAVTGDGSNTDYGWHVRAAVKYHDQVVPVQVDADPTFDEISWKASVDWQVGEPLLGKTLGMVADYDVVAGRFAGEAGGNLSGDTNSFRVQGTFNQGRVTYGDYEATNVTATVDYVLAADGQWRGVLDDVTIGTFDPGVALTDIRTSMRVDDKVVNVGETSARLLGGTVRASPLRYVLEPGDGQLEVRLADIDLGAVLALEGEDLDGSGTLVGTLPLHIVGTAATVTAGTVRSTGPGMIRIAPSLTRVVNQPGLDFALRALEDFSYTSLEADVNYDAAGNLLAAIRLKGRNPAIEKGRPIHYNLNVSENVPSLLASLRVQDDVNERIERRVRAGTGPSTPVRPQGQGERNPPNGQPGGPPDVQTGAPK